MFKCFKKIFPLFLLAIYLSSTMGLVISHIHCFCENNNEVKLFSLKEESCSMCDVKEKQEQTNTCCSKKQQPKKQQKSCCDKEVVYLKINADYKTAPSITILNLLSFYNGIIQYIDPIHKIKISTEQAPFLKEDIPKISGKDIVCYLHQFKFDAAIISC